MDGFSLELPPSIGSLCAFGDKLISPGVICQVGKLGLFLLCLKTLVFLEGEVLMTVKYVSIILFYKEKEQK